MKTYDQLIKVSKKSILTKVFKVDVEKLSPEELEKAKPFLPTEDEKDFMEVYESNIPQLARLQRKMSVCLDVEVLELEESKIVFEYGDSKYTILEPKNAFRTCVALDKGKYEAFSEIVLQGCVLKNDVEVRSVKENSILAVDEINLLVSVTDKFFFRTFLAS